MNKILKVLFLGSFLILLAACSSSDDGYNYEVSQEWKDYQAEVLDKIKYMVDEDGSSVYTAQKSTSGLGSIYYQRSDYINEHMKGNFDVEASDPFKPFGETVEARSSKPIYDTDVVIVRYEGWFYSLDGKRKVFDSTQIKNGVSTNNSEKSKVEFALNSGLIDGYVTLLKEMEVGDEFLVAIPYKMGYKDYGQPSAGIPGYTTLFFDVKLLEIKERK